MTEKKRAAYSAISIYPHTRNALNQLAARLSGIAGRTITQPEAAEIAISEKLRAVEESLGIRPERVDQASGAVK